MRIATWNIDGACGRLGLLLWWLDKRRPDLVALQKIKASNEKFPIKQLRRVGYHAEVHCTKGEEGVAILSRNKPSDVRKGLRDQENLGSRLLTVEVDGLEFSSVYAPWRPPHIASKIEWFKSLANRFREPDSRLDQRVLCGDFNVLTANRVDPSRPRKRADPNYHECVREQFEALLKLGFVDLYTEQPSDWEDRFIYKSLQGCLKFSRLEYILATKTIVDRHPVVAVDVDYGIVKNGSFPWIRAPIFADLDD